MNKLTLKIPPPVQVIICVILMGLLSRYFPIAPHLLAFNKIIASFFLVGGVGFIVPAVRLFLNAKTTVHPMHPHEATTLVTDGIYRYSRNPMYVGLWLILTGVGFFLNALTPFVITVLFILYIEHFQIKPEEEALAELFGEPYKEYLHKVRRWL